jgi:putative transposase
MADNDTMDLLDLLRKRLDGAEPDFLKEMVHRMAEGLMNAEVDDLCGATFGERSENRVNKRNGYRHRPWDTRVGTIDLAIPKLRRGSYFPEWLLEPRRRGERALIAVVAECYLRGVSTRKVDDIVRTLGIEGMSKSQVSELAKELDKQVAAFRNRPLTSRAYPYVWLDALMVKCREAGRVVNVAVVVATAANAEGHREVLGLDVITTEDGAGWLAFVRGLVARGLKGVQLVISDAHAGLKDAIAAALRGATWQRCRTHFMRNLLVRVPRSAQGWVATMVRTIFEQPSADEVLLQHQRVEQQLRARFEKAADLLEEAKDDVLAFTAFPQDHWRRIWSNNPLERLNKELRRRTDVVGIFPNRESIIRLIGATLAEQHDEWEVARRYLTIGSLEKLKTVRDEPIIETQGAQVLPALPYLAKRSRAEASSRSPKAPRLAAAEAKRRTLTMPSTARRGAPVR